MRHRHGGGVAGWRGVACVAWCAAAGATHAAHPLFTEDPGTQGAGRLELELGLAGGDATPPGAGRQALFSPQLSLGVTPTLDLIAQGLWQRQTESGAPTLVGNGGLLADVKWRFFQGEAWTFAVRGGLDLPTGDPQAGLGADGLGAHVIAIAGLAAGAWSLYANAIYARVRSAGARQNVGAFSVALTNTGTEPWQGFVEAATYANPDPAIAAWPAVARTGVIYAVNAWLDVDVGLQARLNDRAPRAVWLAGATLRW